MGGIYGFYNSLRQAAQSWSFPVYREYWNGLNHKFIKPNSNAIYYSASLAACLLYYTSGVVNDNENRRKASSSLAPCYAIGMLGGFVPSSTFQALSSNIALLLKVGGAYFNVKAVGNDKKYAQLHGGNEKNIVPDILRLSALGVGGVLQFFSAFKNVSSHMRAHFSKIIIGCEFVSSGFVLVDGIYNQDKSITTAGIFCLIAARFSGKLAHFK